MWRVIQSLGFELRKSIDHADHDIASIMKGRDVKVIFDVGCNQGLVTRKYRVKFPGAMIHSFEPLEDVANLARNLHCDDRKVVINNIALGEKSGVARFNRNAASDSSSLLETDVNRLPANYKEINKTVNVIEVGIETLDEYCAKNGIAEIDILKLDVQGAELSVLKGAKRMLSEGRIKLIYSEIYFLPFYRNQPLFEDIYEYLCSYNYKFMFPYGLVFGSKTGRLQWGDAIFTTKELYPDKAPWIIGDK